ncbi:EamA domain-containing membrane protein RarD [Litoreibacter ponti]|uniref:EamA domain-containing membrane protein RarD n=1 Tax=Litoreibacter ponti TaxID=1510457 RepID=A0A2T6BMP3_9RHOB|nr:EamA family transporter [Litoreibacter ponti]PTX57353.1 EamA domain-containing membrane protein RarD [Litoreibacter ponti]
MSRATLIGFGAVLLWALLALFTVGSSPVPPFQLSAMAFTLGGAIGLVFSVRHGNLGALVTQTPLQVWALGIGGLFGYHALYFSALRLAPAAEAGLIAYLWPLLIVLFSGLLPGERLRALHVIGALLAFSGAALIVTRGGAGFQWSYATGYGLAALCALTWSGYSVLSRRFNEVPTEIVTFFCLATAVLSAAAHLMFEQTVRPGSAIAWLSIAGLGLGPVGLAFYLWDYGVKRGNIQLLGTASYAAPLLSTLVLIAAGFAAMSASLLAAAVLITAGAGLAALGSRL